MEKKDFYYLHLLPLLCLATGLVLASLCLSAGNNPGFMEEYALVRIDMSQLGNNLFTSSNDTSSEGDDKDKNDKEDDSFLRFARRDISDSIDEAKDKVGDKVDEAKDKAGEKVDEAKDKVKDKVNEFGNEFVDGLAEKLGIKDWYSLHVLTFCQGDYKDETKGDKRVMDVTNCSAPSTEGQFSLTETLGGDSIPAGPIDIPIPSGIQRQLVKLYGVLTGVIFFYGFAIATTALALLSNLFILICPTFYPYRVLAATASLSGTAAFCIFLGSAATTIGVGAAAEALRDLGEFVGVQIVQGYGFVGLTWGAFGTVMLAATYWGWAFWKVRREITGSDSPERKAVDKQRKELKKNSKKGWRSRETQDEIYRLEEKLREKENATA